MVWPAVARSYLQSFERARVERAARLRTAFQAKTLAKRPADLPVVGLDHLSLMTDDTGILQHAMFTLPRREDGYCLDDNARALLLTAQLEDEGTEDRARLTGLSSTYLAFVQHSFNGECGRFRNFMSYSRRWLEEFGSEDSHGRAIWALGTVVGRSHQVGHQSLARHLFHTALPAVESFTSPRAWAFAQLGIDEYLRAYEGDSNVQAVRTILAHKLLDIFRRTSRSEWPWFEDSVTYDNARLSQALIVSGSWMENEEMLATGLRSLEWLWSIQRGGDGYFAPIGSNGFYRRGGRKASFDQQPVEASSMVSALLEAHRVTADERWSERARRAFNWFLGQNHLQQPLFDASTGGCRDGLHVDRANENQGAESTLSFLIALSEMRSSDRVLETKPREAREIAT